MNEHLTDMLRANFEEVEPLYQSRKLLRKQADACTATMPPV